MLKLQLPEVYNPEQKAVIDEALGEIRPYDGFMEYDREGQLIERQGEYFGLFGETAYKLNRYRMVDDEKDSIFENIPVLVDGKLIGQFPDEGASGILHLFRCLRFHGKDRHPAWQTGYTHLGWIRASEIGLSNQEILDNIASEVDDGATHITGGRPGWV